MYWTLEHRMHICPTISDLQDLRNEGLAYFSNGILDITNPHGFHLDYKWDREFTKRGGVAVPTTPGPVNTGLPEIAPLSTLHPSESVYVSSGTWGNSESEITYSYEWFKNEILAEGETINYISVYESDFGVSVTCRVTATNLDGSTVVTSLPYIVDFPQNVLSQAFIEFDAVGGLPNIAGFATFEQSGEDFFQWYRNGSPESGENSYIYNGPMGSGDEFYVETTRINIYSSVTDASNVITAPIL